MWMKVNKMKLSTSVTPEANLPQRTVVFENLAGTLLFVILLFPLLSFCVYSYICSIFYILSSFFCLPPFHNHFPISLGNIIPWQTASKPTGLSCHCSREAMSLWHFSYQQKDLGCCSQAHLTPKGNRKDVSPRGLSFFMEQGCGICSKAFTAFLTSFMQSDSVHH